METCFLILKKKGNLFYVVTNGNFKVNKLGIDLMNYHTETEEIYKKNGQLIKFISETLFKMIRKNMLI